MNAGADSIAATIIAIERRAVDRWNRAEIEGARDVYADDVSYFDPLTDTRIDGRKPVADYFRRFYAGKVHISGYEMVNPQVVTDGDIAVLSYNLINYVRAADGSEKRATHWNSTQVYRRAGEGWRAVHVHWSFTKHPGATEGLTT
jgi:ketosteroid isomerase-like protein